MENQTILLNIHDVKKQTGFKSTQTIYTKMAEDGFPRPISIGDRSNRWIASEVEGWIRGKIEASRKADAQ